MYALDVQSLFIGFGCFVLAVVMMVVFACAAAAGQAEKYWRAHDTRSDLPSRSIFHR